ncbi:MAG: phenylalanine--tRNA ligase subunit beta [Actinomycetota bacterium]
MKVLLSWMREFAPIEGEPAFLAEQMTDLGMVVEEVVATGRTWDGIVVAKVLDLRPHPEADRIQLVDVDTGDGEALQICCGAFNMSVGDLVPLATIGTTMPGGLEIARRKLRGEWSNGMLCSSTELELGDDADGILILDADLTVGQPLAAALGSTTDTLFDLDIEGNRPDALSVAGVTRDLAARLGVPFTLPSLKFAESDPSTAAQGSVEINAPELCARFGLRVLGNVTVGESPAWMAARLVAAGMRPINSVVDISNYVMLELGQPNHTYDLGLVGDGKLGVRMARDGERLVTLDDAERDLTAADGLIVDGMDTPIGLAGVMGGASTEISASTTDVLLEAAVWDRMTIARTSRRLNLRSEASTRFERGVDPMGIERALDRFAELAAEICGATVATGSVVVDGGLAPPTTVEVRTDRINLILNTDLTATDMAALLDPIGFTSTPTADGLSVSVPSWRPDASIEEDVAEEVGRHHGYSKSGKRVPTPTQAGGLTAGQAGRRRLRQALLGAGYSEAMPMPFLAPDDLARAGLVAADDDGASISLTNPLVSDESVLRTSLLPGLLKAVVRNQAHRNGPVRLYELGSVFHPSDDDLPDEFELVAGITSGHPAGGSTPGDTAAEAAVAQVHRLAGELGLAGLTVANAEIPGLHPTRAGEVRFRGKVLGTVGEVDPRVLDVYGVDDRASWFELRVAPILAAIESVPTQKPVPLYPSSDIDLAFATPDQVAATDVARTIKKAGDGLIQWVRLFDVFRSEQLGQGQRSLAYQLRLQATDRTLTDDEVAAVRQRCIDAVEKAHGASLRG